MQPALRIATETARAMPKRINFTVDALNRVTCPAGKDRIWVYDTRQAGLAFMRTAKGAAAFYLYRKIDGRPERIRLDGWPDITIDQARKLAARKIGRIAEGENPAQDKRQARAESTFAEIFQWYIETHAKPHKRTWREDQAKYDQHLANWGSRQLAQIGYGDVQALHLRISKDAPGAANRVMALISVVFNKARQIGYTGPNPVKGVTRNREVSRDRFLLPEEMPRFIAAVDAEKLEVWRDFFKFLLFTGARKGNAQEMRWAEVDLQSAVWTIPAENFKTGQPLSIPLTAPALEILARRRAADPEGQWAFASPDKPGQHIAAPAHAWAAICKRAQLTGLRIHDLRRSFGSWQAATGANLSVIGKSLGHRATQTTAIYARLALDPVRQAADKATAAMLAASRPAEKKS